MAPVRKKCHPLSVTVKSSGVKCLEQIFMYFVTAKFGPVSLLIFMSHVCSSLGSLGNEWKVTLPPSASTCPVTVQCGTQQLLLLLLALGIFSSICNQVYCIMSYCVCIVLYYVFPVVCSRLLFCNQWRVYIVLLCCLEWQACCQF